MKNIIPFFLLFVPLVVFSQSSFSVNGMWFTTQTIIETGDTMPGAESLDLQDDGTCTFTYFDPTYPVMDERSKTMEMNGTWQYDEETGQVSLHLNNPYSGLVNKKQFTVVECNDTCLVLSMPELSYTYIYRKLK